MFEEHHYLFKNLKEGDLDKEVVSLFLCAQCFLNTRYDYNVDDTDLRKKQTDILSDSSAEEYDIGLDIEESELLFIKIDVEGHENHVLQEAGKLLSHLKTLLMIEIEERHNSNYILLFKRLEEKGFKAYYLCNKDLVEIIQLENLSLIMKTNINFIFKNY